MLSLEPSGSAADTLHQRFLDTGFPRTLSRRAFERFDRGAHRPEALRAGCQTWQHRALDEYRSQVAFTELLALLTQARMPFDVIGTCVRVVRDEDRHVELCRRMVAALGGSAEIPGEPNWVPADASLPLLRRIAEIAAQSLCVGETLSMRMLAASVAYTEDPLARAANRCFAADESVHSRFGWTLLGVVVPRLGAKDRRALAAGLPGTLKVVGRMVDASPDVRHPFGYLPKDVGQRVLERCLARDIVRPFQALGFLTGNGRRRTSRG